MIDDPFIYIITALLPLSALLLVFQANPYHALVVRGILGAIAALVYTLFGAADVALTEALVGTMLAITLYAVAVRSSLVVRVGLLKSEDGELSEDWRSLLEQLRSLFAPYQVRVELDYYTDTDSLEQALADKEIHLTCTSSTEENKPYCIITRVDRLYQILDTEELLSRTILSTAGREQRNENSEIKGGI